jgi:hypothetical protein
MRPASLNERAARVAGARTPTPGPGRVASLDEQLPAMSVSLTDSGIRSIGQAAWLLVASSSVVGWSVVRMSSP